MTISRKSGDFFIYLPVTAPIRQGPHRGKLATLAGAAGFGSGGLSVRIHEPGTDATGGGYKNRIITEVAFKTALKRASDYMVAELGIPLEEIYLRDAARLRDYAGQIAAALEKAGAQLLETDSGDYYVDLGRDNLFPVMKLPGGNLGPGQDVPALLSYFGVYEDLVDLCQFPAAWKEIQAAAYKSLSGKLVLPVSSNQPLANGRWLAVTRKSHNDVLLESHTEGMAYNSFLYRRPRNGNPSIVLKVTTADLNLSDRRVREALAELGASDARGFPPLPTTSCTPPDGYYLVGDRVTLPIAGREGEHLLVEGCFAFLGGIGDGGPRLSVIRLPDEVLHTERLDKDDVRANYDRIKELGADVAAYAGRLLATARAHLAECTEHGWTFHLPPRQWAVMEHAGVDMSEFSAALVSNKL